MMRTARILIHPEAFTRDTGFRRKHPREQSRMHLAFIRSLPCSVCGSRRDVHAAHIRMGNALYGKRRTGAGEKPSDHWSVPLCAEHHVRGDGAQHAIGEAAFWTHHGIDPFGLALSLFTCSGDDEVAESVIRAHRGAQR